MRLYAGGRALPAISLQALILWMTLLLASPPNARADWIAGRDLLANEKTGSYTPTTGDPATENTNPNNTVPQWSYGWEPKPASTGPFTGGAFTQFTLTTEHTNALAGDENFEGWFSPGSNVPCIAVNVNAAAVSPTFGASDDPVASGQMFLHPNNTAPRYYAVVRWTAPSSGTYSVSAAWSLIANSSSDGIDVHLLQNNVSIFDANPILTAKNTSTSQPALVLNAGDKLDFLVGPGANGNGTNGTDHSAFNATITLVPEPSSVLMLGLAGLMLSAACFRRR